MKTIKQTLRSILTDWTDHDIREVLHAEPSLICALTEETSQYKIFDTPNGRLAVGSGIGESGATFDSREINALLVTD